MASKEPIQKAIKLYLKLTKPGNKKCAFAIFDPCGLAFKAKLVLIIYILDRVVINQTVTVFNFNTLNLVKNKTKFTGKKLTGHEETKKFKKVGKVHLSINNENHESLQLFYKWTLAKWWTSLTHEKWIYNPQFSPNVSDRVL